MEERAKCLTLRAADLGENDKLITVLTDRFGKLTVKAKGVKKEKAKLKFAVQPFCFTDALLYRKGEYYTLLSADAIEAFPAFLTDYDKMTAGFILLETADKLTVRGADCSGVLTATLKGLGAVCYQNVDPMAACAAGMSALLIEAGYRLELDRCIACGERIEEGAPLAISLSGGGVKCEACAERGDKSLRQDTYQNMKAVRSAGIEDLSGLEIGTEKAKSMVSIYAKMVQEISGQKMNFLK